MLSKIQSANNDISNAYENYVNAVKIEDSLLNRENFARMAELETKYETEKKEREILQQRTKIAENQLRIEQQNLIIFAVIAIAVIAILIGFVVYNRQKLKNHKAWKGSRAERSAQVHRNAKQAAGATPANIARPAR